MRFTGLSGIKEKHRDGSFFETEDEAVELLARDGCTSGCGDNGAITLWTDDEGKYRCEATRYHVTKNSQIFTTLEEVRAWLKVWLPWAQ